MSLYEIPFDQFKSSEEIRSNTDKLLWFFLTQNTPMTTFRGFVLGGSIVYALLARNVLPIFGVLGFLFVIDTLKSIYWKNRLAYWDGKYEESLVEYKKVQERILMDKKMMEDKFHHIGQELEKDLEAELKNPLTREQLEKELYEREKSVEQKRKA